MDGWGVDHGLPTGTISREHGAEEAHLQHPTADHREERADPTGSRLRHQVLRAHRPLPARNHQAGVEGTRPTPHSVIATRPFTGRAELNVSIAGGDPYLYPRDRPYQEQV